MKRALITGAARGIGKASAEHFLREGSRAGLVDEDGEALAQTAGELRGNGRDVLSFVCDVADEEAVAHATGQAAERFDGLDVVVPNAAMQLVGEDDRADRLEHSVWQRTLDVNLTASS